MEIFWILFAKTLPLYLNIILGFFAGKYLHVQGDNIAKLMFYIFMPVVMFHGISNASLPAHMLLLPLLVFGLCTFFCFAFLKIGRYVFEEGSSLPNILGLTVSTANSGYFGLPVALIIFDADTLGVYFAALIGMTLFESSLGYYISAKGIYSAKESVKKVLKLPTLYAFMCGLLVSFNGITLPDALNDYAQNARGGYIILGMMLIGFGMSKMDSAPMDYRFFNLAFTAKFIAWPAVVFALVSLDKHFLEFFDERVYKSLTLLSILPLAANTVAIATVLNAHPSRVATTVLASTLFGMVYVPLMIALLQIQ